MNWGRNVAENAFDFSEVDAAIELAADLEHEHALAVRLAEEVEEERSIRVRAFAQGFTAALEDGNSRDWLDYYEERAS